MRYARAVVVAVTTVLAIGSTVPAAADGVSISQVAATEPVAQGLPVAQSRPATQSQPSTIRVAKPEFDLGTVWEGQVVKHTFEFTNTGSHVIQIREVQTTCGCTRSDDWKKEVAPGDTWRLPVQVDTAGLHGLYAKSVYVTTDAPGRSEVRFAIRGQVRRRFLFDPPGGVNFGPMGQATAARRTVTVVNQMDKPVVFTGVSVDSPSFRASLREIEKGNRYAVDIETVPPLPGGGVGAQIKLQTDLEDKYQATLRVHGYVQPRIALLPSTMMLAMPVQKEQRRRLVLKSTDDTTFEVIGSQASRPGIRVQVDTVRPGREYHVWVFVEAGAELASQGETVTVLTDHAEFPKLTATIRPMTPLQRRPLRISPMSRPAPATSPAAGR